MLATVTSDRNATCPEHGIAQGEQLHGQVGVHFLQTVSLGTHLADTAGSPHSGVLF